ncbi:MAG: hypothetical protein K8W52_34100 [Deltaproteobacteria bacterium]|nr:hypothetical protein [Deltaproteobacteria bacterium]
MIRLLFWLVVAGVLTWCGATVKLGKRTFFGHVSAIWNTPEAQDMKEGVVKEAGPLVDKVERGVKAGYREATDGSGSAGSGADGGAGSGSAEVSDDRTTPPDRVPGKNLDRRRDRRHAN